MIPEGPGCIRSVPEAVMVSFCLRMAGCILIVTGTSGYGLWMSGRYGRQLGELEQLRQMMFLLKGQILYANAPLQEAFEAVGRRMEGRLSQLFLQVADRIGQKQGEMFAQIWKDEVDSLQDEVLLSGEDRQSLAALGEHLGFLDREMQERNLLLYLEQLDLRIQEMREHKKERCRLYTSLGIMSGLFLAILLV